ncbi:MAG: single-stranded DNA-binding protein [Bacteroidales bacterium]|nr:single-stranded DNA-binding protein [Bacteroidales bacterium]MDE7101403.1 single-stranded DNA-binding protein [Bacteroidales bacterium]
MSGVNKVILVGNLGKDPEVFTFENGNKKVRLAVATTETFRNRNGERAEHTEWHWVVLYRGLAEIAEKYLKKGNQVYIEGRLRLRSWNEGSHKRYATEIEAQDMTMLGGANGKKDEKPAVLQGTEAIPQVPAKLEDEPEYNPQDDNLPF